MQGPFFLLVSLREMGEYLMLVGEIKKIKKTVRALLKKYSSM
jgi:hypothetical protein